MTGRIPLLSTQLGFALMAERTDRRVALYEIYRMSPAVLSVADLKAVIRSVMARNPTLSCRIRLHRGDAYQERYVSTYDFAELQATDEEGMRMQVAATVDEFEAALDGVPLSARLLHCPDADYVLLILDHALVDGQSLLIIKEMLEAPSPPEDSMWERFEAAVADTAAIERAAIQRGLGFWADRLKFFSGVIPKGAAPKNPRNVRFVSLPGVVVPSGLRGSCFPYVLFALHRALRDVTAAESTVIGYPWGRQSAVTGCFLNTTISLDLTGPRSIPEAMADFLDGWYAEIDHADVPLLSIAELGSNFSGSVAALLNYAVAPEDELNIAGVPAVEISPGYGHAQAVAPVTVVAVVRHREIRLQIVLDKEVTGYSAHDLGTRWRHRLAEAFSAAPRARADVS